MKLSFKTFKKRCQHKLKQNHRVWDQHLRQDCPWRSPRQVPEPAQAAPRELWASPGSLCDSCLAPPGTPREPLTPPWHCLDASKSYFGSLKSPNVWFQNVLGPRIRLKIEDLSIMFLISTILSCIGFVFPYVFGFMDFLVVKLLNC